MLHNYIHVIAIIKKVRYLKVVSCDFILDLWESTTVTYQTYQNLRGQLVKNLFYKYKYTYVGRSVLGLCFLNTMTDAFINIAMETEGQACD